MGDNIVIITGAGGRVANLLQKYWENKPPCGIKVLWAGRRGSVDIFWDIQNSTAPLLPKRAVIVHLAARLQGSAQELDDNVKMIAPLLAACRQAEARGIIFASTAAVYAQDGTAAREENVNPANDYGRSKLAAEAELVRLCPDMAYLILRIGNVAGADALLGQEPSNEIVLDPIDGRSGGPERSWIGPIALADLVQTFALQMHEGKLMPAVLNVAAQPPLKMADILTAAGRKWRYGPPKAGVIASATLSTDLLTRFYGNITTNAHQLVSEVQKINEF